MKILVATGFLAAAVAFPALAQNTPTPNAAGPHQICIRPFDSPTGSIDHTKYVAPQTILFYMRDGKIWKNTLHTPCRGLEFHGFSFVTHYDEICSNAVSIQVIETGQVCQLGDFTPYTPAPGADSLRNRASALDCAAKRGKSEGAANPKPPPA